MAADGGFEVLFAERKSIAFPHIDRRSLKAALLLQKPSNFLFAIVGHAGDGGGGGFDET